MTDFIWRKVKFINIIIEAILQECEEAKHQENLVIAQKFIAFSDDMFFLKLHIFFLS